MMQQQSCFLFKHINDDVSIKSEKEFFDYLKKPKLILPTFVYIDPFSDTPRGNKNKKKNIKIHKSYQ